MLPSLRKSTRKEKDPHSVLGKRVGGGEDIWDEIASTHSSKLYVDTSSGPAWRPNASEMRQQYNLEREQILLDLEERASDVAFYNKVQMNDSLGTPMERYLRFADARSHVHLRKKNAIDPRPAFELHSAHPERFFNPRATLTTDARITLDNLSERRNLERFLGPRGIFPNPSPKEGEELDIRSFTRKLLDHTSLSLYGTWAPSSDMLVVIVRLDGVSRHFAALVFGKVRYITEKEIARVEEEIDGDPPPEARGRPLYHYYFLCDCKHPPPQ